MKTLLLLLSLAFFSCQQAANNATAEDSGAITDPARLEYLKDSLRKDIDSKIAHEMIPDSAIIANAPIKILAAKVVQEEYSSYKDVFMEWKNVSGKTIDAVRFNWYGVNAFGEDADMGGYTPGIGGGFSDNPLATGKSTSGTWNVLSRDAKKIVKAWPTEIAFADGTKWKLEK